MRCIADNATYTSRTRRLQPAGRAVASEPEPLPLCTSETPSSDTAARAPRQAEDATRQPDQEAIAMRAAAMLPAELLQPHELIILLLKPSPWFIVLAPLRTLVILALATWAAVALTDYADLGLAPRDLVLLGVALIGIRLFWQFLEWLSRVYVLTDQRMVRVRGVLRVHVFECRLNQIQHTEALFSIRERLFALGSIAFATAGTAFPEVHWQMVARPLEVHQRVVQTLRRYRR